MLEFRNVSIAVDMKLLFKNLNLKVEKGEKICLSGHSGLGKTSLFNALLGFLPIKSGEILYRNTKLNDFRNFRKNIAYLPQNQNIIGLETVKDTIYAPFEFAVNKKYKPNPELIKEYFKALDLELNLMHKPFDSLSGGEKQRIGLIITKCLKKTIMLLDEPSSALDADTTTKAANFILTDPEPTLLSISHDINWQQNFARNIEFSSLIEDCA